MIFWTIDLYDWVDINCAPLVADLILFYNERDFMLSLSNNIQTMLYKVGKRAKIRNRSNQAPHLTKDTNGKVTTSQLDDTSESQEVSPFPAGDHKVSINRGAQKHNKYKTEIT